MRVDEAGDAGEPAPVDLAAALVARMRADDAVADDRDIAPRDRPGDDVEEVDVANDEVRRFAAGARRDRAGKKAVSIPFPQISRNRQDGKPAIGALAASSPPAAGALASASGARPSVRLVR